MIRESHILTEPALYQQMVILSGNGCIILRVVIKFSKVWVFLLRHSLGPQKTIPDQTQTGPMIVMEWAGSYLISLQKASGGIRGIVPVDFWRRSMT